MRHPRHVLLALAAASLALATGIGSQVQQAFSGLPPLDTALLRYRQSVQIVDRAGGELYRMYDGEDRIVLDASDLSPYLRHAIVAIEDERFYDRWLCLDLRAIARSFMANLQSGQTLQGGSTITQQLVRSVYLTPEKTLNRKLREVALACQLERTYSKDQILALYLNRVSFGGTIYGAERAARAYFGVSARDLTLPQAAILAAIPQRPSVYTDPKNRRTAVDHALMNDLRSGTVDADALDDAPMRAGLVGRSVSTPRGDVEIRGRVDAVLDAMERNRFISLPQRDVAALIARRVPMQRMVESRLAPHFVEAVRLDTRALLEHLGDGDAWIRSGMIVRTTIDPALQRLAERTLRDAHGTLENAGARHAAIVVIDRKTREVLAYVGNVDYNDPDAGAVDMARAPRQTGSAIKPIVYAADFDQTGSNSGTFILDGPLPEIGNPKNFDGAFRGWMRMKNALGASRNIPAIRAFFDAGGEETVLRIAADMGVGTPLAVSTAERTHDPWFSFGWPMAIGSAEVPLVELTQGYATIAEGGVYLPLRTVDRIDDVFGGTLLVIPSGPAVQVIDPAAANDVDEILRDPLTRPQGFWRAMLTVPGVETGVKTGTSNLCLRRSAVSQKCLSYGVNNVWTVGYDDTLVVGVWVGNADNAPMIPTADGLTVAAPMWKAFLQEAQGRIVADQ